MKIKYYKITKFNVVFNLKRIEGEQQEKFFGRNLMFLLVIIKSGGKESVKQENFVPHFFSTSCSFVCLAAPQDLNVAEQMNLTTEICVDS